jgi:hypothetical protein
VYFARNKGDYPLSEVYNWLMDKISAQNDRPVKDYIASLDDEQTVKDSQALIEMMQRISGHEPKMWNIDRHVRV